jgi:N-acylneuraminate cytidylyltransferase/CMP-N,N'-diacetyllegionaminic acid synthase
MNQHSKNRRSCLGILTARGGSKGVPRKNIRLLAGKPAIAYTIEAAIGCPHIDQVLVTTDSPEIQAAAMAFGAQAPFLRPAELATDTANQEDAVLHAMNWCEHQGQRFDLICLLEPTLPLRRAATLSRGFDLLSARPQAAGVFSVSRASTSPIKCNVLRLDGTLRDFMDRRFQTANRQELPDYYALSGAVVIIGWDCFRQTESFLNEESLYLVVDAVEAIDIDHPVDFVLANELLSLGIDNTDSLRQRLDSE